MIACAPSVATYIRRARVEDLSLCAEAAEEFYGTSRFLDGFQLSRFVAAWTSLITTGTGVAFLVWSADRKVVGGISGVAYPDINSGELIGQEFWLFLSKQHRGGFTMLKLCRSFEKWCADRGCRQVRLAHLQDSQPEQLKSAYECMGYIHSETLYTKVLPSKES